MFGLYVVTFQEDLRMFEVYNVTFQEDLRMFGVYNVTLQEDLRMIEVRMTDRLRGSEIGVSQSIQIESK